MSNPTTAAEECHLTNIRRYNAENDHHMRHEDNDPFSWTARRDLVPIFMIPSMAGTRLRTWSHLSCSALIDFKVGGTVWLDAKRLIAATNCWMKCISLDPRTQRDKECIVRPDEGLDAVTQVDETIPAGFLWKAFIQMLASNSYEPERDMFAHPYDWRLPPQLLQRRDYAFSRLKENIEIVVAERATSDPDSPNRGVTLVGLSLGNLFIQYFFDYLRIELGERGLTRWTEKHVFALVLCGAPFLGAVGPIRALMVGDPNGLPISNERSRDLMLTFGSMPWMMPRLPPTRNARHAAVNLGETDFPVDIVKVRLRNGTTVRPANADVTTSGGWLGRLGDDRLRNMQRTIDRSYMRDDDVMGGNVLKPFTPPKGIDHVICSYGVNVPTPVGVRYAEETTAGYYEETDVIMGVRGRVYYEKQSSRVSGGEKTASALPRHRESRSRKSGDGTVPYFSLSWCHSWLDGAVNVTRVPTKEYEEDDVRTFRNVEMTNRSQYDAVHRDVGPFNTFYTRYWVDKNPITQLQRPRSVQVWEMEGIRHRDSVTDPRVLNQIRLVLEKSNKQMERYANTIKAMRREAWDAVDKTNVLRTDFIREIALESASWGEHDLPDDDDDCWWDYAHARCAWPRYCEYSFRIGDLHLSQSCRLRLEPLPKNHPLLSSRDVDVAVWSRIEASSPSSSSRRGEVEYRIVYEEIITEGLFGWDPWIVVLCTFVLSFLTFAFAARLCRRRREEVTIEEKKGGGESEEKKGGGESEEKKDGGESEEKRNENEEKRNENEEKNGD